MHTVVSHLIMYNKLWTESTFEWGAFPFFILEMCTAQRVQSTYIHADISDHRVQTEWHWPLSGVHYIVIMMEKSAQAGEGGGVRAYPFTMSTITYKIVVYAPAEWADTHPISTLSLYVLCVFDIWCSGNPALNKGSLVL
jgi:hypothetical protein